MATWPDDPLVAASVVLGVVGGLVAVALGALVLRAEPARSVNRALAALLFAEGFAHSLVLLQLDGMPAASRKVLGAVHLVCITALPFLYLRVLATLATPLVAFLRRPAVRAFLTTYPVLVLVISLPVHFSAPVAGDGPAGLAGVFYRASVVLVGAVSVFGLVASFSELRGARPGSPRRARAVAYAAAFGARDVFFALLLLNALVLHWERVSHLWPSLATFVFAPLLAYGLLRTQLLDVDLKLKWTIERGTVALVFLGMYLVVSQAAQSVVSARYGPALGIAAALALVFALVPLQRFASRVGAFLVPGVDGSPRYLNARRLAIYHAAVEHALAEHGALPPRERARLDALRARLALDADGAALAESAARAEHGAAVNGHLSPGDVVLGKYRIVRVLGAGAHGRTFLAEQAPLGRHVVVKAMRAGVLDEAAALREARALAAVRHPSVVTIHDVEPRGGRLLLVMEYVDGGSLRDALDAGPLGVDAFRRVAVGLLAALHAVHGAGLVHRDVKPANVLLTRDGDVKLADFGVAHVAAAEATVALGEGAEDAGGTVRYMSPEQAKGRRVTASSDLFSAAATLYEAVTGRPWLDAAPGESTVELRMRAAAGARPPHALDDVPEPLRAWFARGLDPDPARRFASAAEMRDALAAALPVVQ